MRFSFSAICLFGTLISCLVLQGRAMPMHPAAGNAQPGEYIQFNLQTQVAELQDGNFVVMWGHNPFRDDVSFNSLFNQFEDIAVMDKNGLVLARGSEGQPPSWPGIEKIFDHIPHGRRPSLGHVGSASVYEGGHIGPSNFYDVGHGGPSNIYGGSEFEQPAEYPLASFDTHAGNHGNVAGRHEATTWPETPMWPWEVAHGDVGSGQPAEHPHPPLDTHAGDHGNEVGFHVTSVEAEFERDIWKPYIQARNEYYEKLKNIFRGGSGELKVLPQIPTGSLGHDFLQKMKTIAADTRQILTWSMEESKEKIKKMLEGSNGDNDAALPEDMYNIVFDMHIELNQANEAFLEKVRELHQNFKESQFRHQAHLPQWMSERIAGFHDQYAFRDLEDVKQNAQAALDDLAVKFLHS